MLTYIAVIATAFIVFGLYRAGAKAWTSQGVLEFLPNSCTNPKVPTDSTTTP